MSKKSRKRNKKILAAIGIGLGAAALASKRKSDLASTEDGKSAKADRGFTMADVANTPKKDTSKSDVAPVAKKDTVPVGKMRGAGNTDAEAIAAQKKRAGNAQNIREAQADETSVGNYPTDTFIKPYNKSRTRGGAKNGGRMGLKSGGSTRGCGKALRGFGKAMKGKR